MSASQFAVAGPPDASTPDEAAADRFCNARKGDFREFFGRRGGRPRAPDAPSSSDTLQFPMLTQMPVSMGPGGHSLLLRLRRRREVLLHPRVPQRLLAGDGSGRLIAVQVEAQCNHTLAAHAEGAQGGYARPRLVDPQQGVARFL